MGALRLLAAAPGERGDLFTTLIQDLFFALGYGEFRLNVHKSGREIDIIGNHRLERRTLLAECKAQEAKIGGDDLNKFLGILTRERAKAAAPIGAYFVSLSGFTETAIEQEIQSDPGITLVAGPRSSKSFSAGG